MKYLNNHYMNYQQLKILTVKLKLHLKTLPESLSPLKDNFK